MGRYLAPAKTPVTMEQTFASLARNALDLGPESLLVLLSHVSLETDEGRAMRNYSVAGIKAIPAGRYDWTFYQTSEVENGKRTVYPAPPLEVQPTVTSASPRAWLQTCFRAFETLDAAIVDYVETIRTRFGDAWPAVVAGKSYDFGLRLGDNVGSRYFTADPPAYARALAQRFEVYRARMPSWRSDA
jgi:hypothetical protein